ncbi:ABC transporter ATP-binding protein [Myxococcota bacterium]|nr:ABC transporter ATP-binding protein [Myxococcota bacterium]
MSLVAPGHPLLELQDLHVHYGAIHAIKGISLSVRQGEILTLIGSNGAGKSTTLRAISALVRASGGRILYRGHAIQGYRADQVVGMGIAHCPEGRGVFPAFTVRENLEVGAFLRKDREGIEADIETAFTRFPVLRQRARQPAGTLSGGEQQMLAISRALMCRPALLLLDEPSLGLAPQVVQTIFAIIREINRAGTTILLVEQNAHMALQVAHQACVLDVGTVVASGPAADLARSDEVKKAYLGGH